MSDWGKGVDNNTIEWGRGSTNNSIGWGEVYANSPSGDTALAVSTPSFSNTKSVDFDGVDDYVDLGNPTALQFTSSFSISLWFKSTDTSDYILISKDKTSGHATLERSWALWGNRYGGTNVLNFNVRSGSTSHYLPGTVDHNDGNWHHVVATFEASTALKLYVDGSLEATKTSPTPPSTINNVPTNANIGRSTSNLYYANAKIDEVGLFNSVLSASDVTAIYNSSNPLSLSSYSPLAWYRMGDGDTFPTLTDNGSGGNNGTMTNMVSGDIVADVPPTFNKFSIDFDGVDDSCEIGNPANLQLTGAMTLSMWFKGQPTTTGQYAGIDKLGNASNRGAALVLRKATGIYFYIAPTSSSLAEIHTTDTTPLTDGNWHHVMAVYIPSTSMKLYLDGSEVASDTSSISAQQSNNSSNPWSIGKRSAHSNFMNGNIDEVSIFSSALNIGDLWDGSTKPTDLTSLSPLGWWRFEAGSGTTVTDSGSGGNDGTLLNGATYSTDKP